MWTLTISSFLRRNTMPHTPTRKRLVITRCGKRGRCNCPCREPRRQYAGKVLSGRNLETVVCVPAQYHTHKLQSLSKICLEYFCVSIVVGIDIQHIPSWCPDPLGWHRDKPEDKRFYATVVLRPNFFTSSLAIGFYLSDSDLILVILNFNKNIFSFFVFFALYEFFSSK